MGTSVGSYLVWKYCSCQPVITTATTQSLSLSFSLRLTCSALSVLVDDGERLVGALVVRQGLGAVVVVVPVVVGGSRGVVAVGQWRMLLPPSGRRRRAKSS